MHINPLRAVASDRLALTGFAILSSIVLMAILAPVLTFFPPDYYTGLIFSPPSYSHLLGTDSMGQDIWSRLLFGARTTLLVAASVAILIHHFERPGGSFVCARRRHVREHLHASRGCHAFYSAHHRHDPGGCLPSAQSFDHDFASFPYSPADRRKGRSLSGLEPEGEGTRLCVPNIRRKLGAHPQEPYRSGDGASAHCDDDSGRRRAVFLEAGMGFLGVSDLRS